MRGTFRSTRVAGWTSNVGGEWEKWIRGFNVVWMGYPGKQRAEWLPFASRAGWSNWQLKHSGVCLVFVATPWPWPCKWTDIMMNLDLLSRLFPRAQDFVRSVGEGSEGVVGKCHDTESECLCIHNGHKEQHFLGYQKKLKDSKRWWLAWLCVLDTRYVIE